MSRPRLAAAAALVALTFGLAAFLVLGGTADTEPVSASGAVGSARNQPITGKLSKPGYTVIVLARNGTANSVRAGSGQFRLRPPAKKVTLHLRAPDGTYAGPVVVAGKWNLVKVAKKKLRRAERKLKKAKARLSKASGKKATRKAKRKVSAARKKLKQARRELKTARRRASGKEAVLGVAHGAALGAVSVKAAAGYAKAKLKLRQWKRWAVEENRARAKNGAPIGAGRFGFVRVKGAKAGVPGDGDRDGVADQLDVDDNGNLVLDPIDRKGGARAAQAYGSSIVSAGFADPWIDPSLSLVELEETVNANATGLTVADVDAFLSTNGFIGINFPELLDFPTELDCGQPQDSAFPGLVYCTRGGTGTWNPDETAKLEEFPECCDDDGDGFGSLFFTAQSPTPFGFRHGARSDQIKTGDLLVLRVTEGDSETELPLPIPFVFATVPALVSYSDTAGNSAVVSYPVERGDPGTGPFYDEELQDANFGNPFPIAAGDDGRVVLTFTLWRPQRTPIPSEAGEWIDIGGLDYNSKLNLRSTENLEDPTFLEPCPGSAFSTSDPNLNTRDDFGQGWLRDSASDQTADAANTLTYTFDVTDCLASNGFSVPDVADKILEISFGASSALGPSASSRAYFRVE